MNALLLVGMLCAGPPALPDLPAERAAKARAAEAQKEREAQQEREALKPSEPAPTKAEPAPSKAKPAPSKAEPSRAPEPKTVVTAEQLRAASPRESTGALPEASAGELQLWSEDDAVYGAPAEPDAGAGTPGPPRAPTRTARPLAAGDPLEGTVRPTPPTRSAAFVFGYRIFQTTDAFARPQSWHVGSLEVTPVRRWVRFNLVTEVGAEGGAAARSGDRADLYMMEKAGLGAQYPGWLTPFIEFQGGAGVARVELFDRNDLLLIWTLGLDAGAQWAVTKWMWIHASVGWVRPTFQRPERAVYHDSFTFKLGLGF